MSTDAAAAGIARLRARIRQHMDPPQAPAPAPAAAPDPEFALRVRRLASELWRARRPAGATGDALAAWEETNPTTAFFREALQQLEPPPPAGPP